MVEATGIDRILSGPKRFINRELIPALANLNFAIVMLLVIALFSILGTVIEQGQGLAFYQANYPEKPALFGFLTWKVLLTAGLDHVYRTWWYLGLLVLFGASLLSCTIKRQWPALKWFSRDQKLYSRPQQFKKFAVSTQMSATGLDSLVEQLTARKYRIVREGDRLYARKGIVGRIGPIIVHASMILILLGGVVGALTGFISQEMIPSGETFKIQNVVDAGPFADSQVPKDWSVKVNRFWIDYLPTGEIDQFYSDLSVLDKDEKEVDHQTIHVNKPLKHNGVTLYQASWGISAIKVRFNNSPELAFPMGQLKGMGGQLWGTFVPTKPDLSDGVSLVVKDLQGLVLVYNKEGKLVATARKGMAVDVNGIKLAIADIVGSTGLQIKADPGIPIVYLGFGLLMLSTLMSYISHSQVWGLYESGTLYLGGTTNRALVTFEQEFVSLTENLKTQPEEAVKS